jgi:hypothetical protein
MHFYRAPWSKSRKLIGTQDCWYVFSPGEDVNIALVCFTELSDKKNTASVNLMCAAPLMYNALRIISRAAGKQPSPLLSAALKACDLALKIADGKEAA